MQANPACSRVIPAARPAGRWLRSLLLCLCLIGTFRVATAAAAPRPPLLLGTAWYPEQWPESRWPKDLALMQAAHIDVVRVGEFAWSTLEPRQGDYHFGWLERAIAEAARHHIYVVIGTPTAAPPAWLTSRYPQTLRVHADGRRAEHGNRQQFSFSSRLYRKFCREIAARLAQHFGHNPDVIGWQIDNEIGPPSFGAQTRRQFHAWLRHKYRTIAALNRRWATTYWSQTYDHFSQVPMRAANENPGLLLDFRRFVTATWASYVQNQVQAIRRYASARQFITTNTTHWGDQFDEYTVNRELTLASWDDYVPNGRYRWLDNALEDDLVRGYKRQDFWVMETQPAFVDWGRINAALSPSEMHDLAWQDVGHGANAVLYWQWRSALNGQEQYNGTLLGPGGEPVPAYGVVKKIAAQFALAGPALAGTSPRSRVAVLQSYPSRWAIDFQRQTIRFGVVHEFTAFYKPLERFAQAVDVVSPHAPLGRYRLVVAPALNVLSRAEARHLAAYVRAGGHLVLGPRSGMKNSYDALWSERQPGPLVPLLGGHVGQYYSLLQPVALAGALGAGHASVWAETLAATAPDTRVLMRYGKGNAWLEGKPAIITRHVGKGTITYVGAWLDPALMQTVLEKLARAAGVHPLLPGVARNVEVCQRIGAGNRVWILINHGHRPHTVHLPSPASPLLTAGPARRTVALAPHEVSVLVASHP
ncbi:MAG: beta-galactosidase [Pseudomonadota bacterium]|nr:beta-galactosidase [Pseudomonadota bacterium]